MRIDDVDRNNKQLAKSIKLSTEEGRQMALLSVMTDISETLAMLLDMYGVVHGRYVKGQGETNVPES